MRFAVMLAAVAALFVQAGQARAATWVIGISGVVTGVTYTFDPNCGQPVCNDVVTPYSTGTGMTVEIDPFFGTYEVSRQIGARKFLSATLHFDGYYLTGTNLSLYEEESQCTGSNRCVRHSARADTFTPTVISGSPVALGPVPEPTSWAMLLIGFFAIGAAMRHRPRLLSENLMFTAPPLPPMS